MAAWQRNSVAEKLAILRHSLGWVRVVTPFHRGWVEQIKLSLPVSARKWDPEGKFWLVSDAYLAELVKTMRDAWPGVEIESDLGETTTPQRDQLEWVADLFRAVPQEHRTRIWKALATAFHPDTNPSIDPQILTKINSLYQELTKEK